MLGGFLSFCLYRKVQICKQTGSVVFEFLMCVLKGQILHYHKIQILHHAVQIQVLLNYLFRCILKAKILQIILGFLPGTH